MSTARLLSDLRGARYGEVLAVFCHDGSYRAEVYGTQMLNDCPPELWERLEPEEIAKELRALAVKLNGPRHWMIDGLGQKVAIVEPVLREFSGLLTRRIAVVSLGSQPFNSPYNSLRVNRGAVFFFDAAKPVYELVDPSGLAYVMQAYCTGVDESLRIEHLDSLGSRLALPPGWSYRTRLLDEELVIDTSASLATVLQDEFENTYTLPF
ncbi:MAG: hypothetical protein HKL86_10960 [Acidimicrobiaceae bacterium]|nr:hypothetical protein [Acidimicrobiaceae bacterium]